MINVWQDVQGDYKPAEVFKQNGMYVIARNIRLVEDNIWQWQECRIAEHDYLDMVAAIDNQTSDSIFEVAGLADENSGAIDDLAAMVDDLEQRVSALEERNGE